MSREVPSLAFLLLARDRVINLKNVGGLLPMKANLWPD